MNAKVWQVTCTGYTTFISFKMGYYVRLGDHGSFSYRLEQKVLHSWRCKSKCHSACHKHCQTRPEKVKSRVYGCVRSSVRLYLTTLGTMNARTTFCTNSSVLYWDFWPGCIRRKVRKSTMLLSIIQWGPWTSIEHFSTIHPVVEKTFH